MDEARLELGVVHQALGNSAAALAAYEYVGEHSPVESYRRAARLNRAKLDFDSGRASRAWRASTRAPRRSARRPDGPPRALIALHTGRFALAESDLDRLLATAPEDAEALGYRAVAATLPRPAGRRRDGRATRGGAGPLAQSRAPPQPRPARARAVPTTYGSKIPTSFASCRRPAPRCAADLRRSPRIASRPAPPRPARSTRAVILSVLGDHAEAETEATRAIESSPSSPRARLVRARVRRLRGDRKAAMEDVAAGLAGEPDDPRLLGLKATLRIESGDPAGGLAELDRAVSRIGGVALIRPRAEARTTLGRDARADWNRVIASDPTDPTAYLGRARAFLRLAQWDQALADLEARLRPLRRPPRDPGLDRPGLRPLPPRPPRSPGPRRRSRRPRTPAAMTQRLPPAHLWVRSPRGGRQGRIPYCSSRPGPFAVGSAGWAWGRP